MTNTYHFGVPATLVWSSHILLGLYFIYIGYLLFEGKKINKYISISLIVIGILAILYHLHLWYNNKKGKVDEVNKLVKY